MISTFHCSTFQSLGDSSLVKVFASFSAAAINGIFRTFFGNLSCTVVCLGFLYFGFIIIIISGLLPYVFLLVSAGNRYLLYTIVLFVPYS
jgi:hypothetical protein